MQSVETLRLKPESWGLIPDGVLGIFPISLGLTQPLTEMSARNLSWEVKAAGA